MLKFSAQTMLNIAQIALKTVGIFAQHSTQTIQQTCSTIVLKQCSILLK